MQFHRSKSFVADSKPRYFAATARQRSFPKCRDCSKVSEMSGVVKGILLAKHTDVRLRKRRIA